MNWLARTISAIRRSYMTDFTRGLDLDGASPSTGLRSPYAQSVWVAAAIGLVTQPLKAVSLKFYAGEAEHEDPALASWWRNPATGMSYEEFIDATAGWLKLAGEFFWILDDTWLGRSARRSRLVVAAPEAMRHIVQGGELQGWVYTDRAGRQIPLLPEQVIHAKRWNPADPWRGLGEITAARLAAETDFLAGRYARDTYANYGDTGDYIAAKNGSLTDEQREQVTAALRAKRAAKLRGDFRPLFFSSDIEVKSPTITAPDAAFVANRLQSRQEVFIAFGVPPSMADVQASYSIGSASDYFRLIHGASIPVGNTICGAIDQLLAIQTGREIQSYFDFDEHPTMQQVRSERIDAAAKLWAMGVPMSEINGYLDMGMSEFPGWDIGYLPFSVQPAASPLEPAPAEPGAPAAPAEPLDDPVALMLRSLKCCPAHAPVLKTESLKTGNSSWQAHWRARQGTIKSYSAKFSRCLMDARVATLDRLNKSLDLRATKSTPAAAIDIVFDLDEFADNLRITLNKAGRAALTTAAQQCLAEIGAATAWEMPPAKVNAYLASRENFFTDIADDIHSRILGTLDQGITAGESIPDLAARVRAEFSDINRARSIRIAMTETSAAYGAARQDALEGAGIQFKRWLTSGNENVRDSHAAANGQTVPVSEPFTIAGSQIMHPGDGSLGAPPEEIINCHCVAIASQNE